MQKYRPFKETGLDWMGEVPFHWRKDKISRMVEFSASGGTPTSSNEGYYNGDIKWVQTGELNDCDIFDSEKKLTEEGFQASSTKIFPAETLLIAMYGATIGKLGILKTDATSNQACCALFFNDKKWNTKYFFYYFLNIREKLIFSSYGGGQPNISQEVIKQESLFVPLLPEQTAITNYLDQATSNIDKVISTKQIQLEKLEQYKRSKIYECVTKGLNPNPKLKPSGIDWIGDIPEGWKAERIKDVVQLRTEKTSEKSQYKDYLELEDLEQWTGNILGFRDTTEVSSDVTIFKKGDILFGKLRPYLAKYWLAECDGKCTGEIIAFNCLKIQNVFFKYFIGSTKFIELCTAVSYGAKMPRVDWTRQIAYFYVAFPNKDEQIDIANYLNNFCLKIGKEKKIIEKQIEKLKLYRKCLIHECVTGKRKIIEE